MRDINKLLMRLNPEQLRAATSIHPRILVLAGAGSGKTSVLTTRIANLQVNHRIGTSNMLAITFTRLAALEMKQRVAKLLGDSLAKNLTAGTFHSFCVKVLRQYGWAIGVERDFSVYSEEDRNDLLTSIVSDLGLASKVKPQSIYVWSETSDPYDRQVSNEYRYRLRQNNAVDLDGLLALTINLLEGYPDIAEDLRKRFTYVFVDEYQDTDDRQERILQLINPENLFVVGDAGQAIYGWRGARIENILTFEERNPGCLVIKLERNYRSTEPILDLANRVLEGAAHRSPLELWTDKAGVPVRVNCPGDQDCEAHWIIERIEELKDQAETDIAILCRTNRQIEFYADVLRKHGIKTFVVSGSDVLDSYDVRRVIDYMAYFCNNLDNVAFKRLIHWPRPWVTERELQIAELLATKENITLAEAINQSIHLDTQWEEFDDHEHSEWQQWQEDVLLMHDRLTYFLGLWTMYEQQGLQNRIDALRRFGDYLSTWKQRQIEMGEPYNPYAFLQWLKTRDIQERLELERPEGVQIMTVHAAKGLEFKHVFVPGCNERIFPTKRGDLEEERRLFYVAVTRAKDTLTLSYATSRMNAYSHELECLEPSRFLDALMTKE
jgi:DNA helicase-2/ATP-dependent DNA helicase PcrA